MRLTGKTRAELESCLADKSRAELLDLLFSLVTFERLLTAREIAEASHVAKRDVLAAMRAGCFVDPLHGRGFFCRAGNSLRVSAGAANAWRRSFFVPVVDPIPPHKKDSSPSVIGAGAGKSAQRRNGSAARPGAGEVMRDQMLQPRRECDPADSLADYRYRRVAHGNRAGMSAIAIAARGSVAGGGGGSTCGRAHGHLTGKCAEISRNKGALAA